MTQSIWRFAHLALAVSISVFLFIVASTGIILAGASITEKVPYAHAESFQHLSLSEMLPKISTHFLEVNEVKVSPKYWVTVKGLNENGDETEVFVHPKTGEIVGAPEKESQFIQDVTTLHRSLFLHETGRFIMGVNAFLLILITVTGIILVVKRQKGILRFFTKIQKENWATYYHVRWSRYFLFPILIIAITATFLSLIRFKAFGADTIPTNQIDFVASKATLDMDAFPSFKKIHLSEVQKIEFPFTDDIEECFTVKLHDRELKINQFDGRVLSEVKYPKTVLLETLSLDLHTGRTSIVWALVLGISSLVILFFMYSGFAITLKRKKVKIHNPFTPSEGEILILVGSENGSTFEFAQAVHQQLLNLGEKSFLMVMNRFQDFPKVHTMLVFTSTYGLGDAPSNANHFEALIQKYPFSHPVKTTVIGFGSQNYPDFCGYAVKVQAILERESWSHKMIDLHTINDKSITEFLRWVTQWNISTGIPLSTSMAQYRSTSSKRQEFKVIDKKIVVGEQTTFRITLQPLNKLEFQSGDLFTIFPKNDTTERLYSIGKVSGNVQLVVKLHEKGVGSSYLYQLEIGSVIKAKVLKNNIFHLPNKPVLGIANGTGIAPFLGMLHEKSAQMEGLYVGFRHRTALVDDFEKQAKVAISNQKLKSLNIAFSREGERLYVTDLILRDIEKIKVFLANGGVMMICGSLAMLQDVETLLIAHCGATTWQNYKDKGQFLSDCY